jgi:N6-adenosine-specific RNA methylase IME4
MSAAETILLPEAVARRSSGLGPAPCSASRSKYKTILCDPPWDYRNGGNGRARAHYKLMTIDELCAMNVEEHADKDAVLLMWATWPQVEGAVRVGKAWGFEYVTGFPWLKTYDPPFCDLLGETIVKPTYGTGCWVRGCSEPIFIFRRGKAKPPLGSWMGLISERMEHSRKPDTIYAYAESFPGPYLEMFCRRPRAGWHVFGNEVESDVALVTPNGPDQRPPT